MELIFCPHCGALLSCIGMFSKGVELPPCNCTWKSEIAEEPEADE